MVTAYGREEVLKQAEENAFANVLIKPVTPSMLFDSAIEVLGAGQEKAYDLQPAPTIELARLRGARVLLAEDNELNQEVALGLLKDANLIIEVADNGQIAVEMAGSRSYDVVLMDMQMPVMDGVTATKAIRSHAQLRNLPIIAMTANVMAADREKCIEAGMNDHVAKPIDPTELFATLLRWIKPRDGNGAAPPAALPAATLSTPPGDPGSDRLLEIPGVDTKSALRRTGGNRKRYESLLRKFAQPNAAGVEEIRSALAAGDTQAAARAAHSLKGAAANLGATALAEVAAKTETAVHLGQGVDEALRSLAVSFDTVVAAIRSSVPPEPVAPVSGSAAADPSTVSEPLRRLEKLLKNDDGDAADFILEARPVLSKVLTEPEITTLSEQVGNFDFAAALQSLFDIARRLSLKLE
jgi:two-component system, sensor histidine kinase and response regulator